MFNSYSKDTSSERGTLIIELALVIGILAFSSFVGLEIARYLQQSQTAISLTQELGNMAVRDCYDVCDRQGTSNCIKFVESRVQRIAQEIIPTMRIRTRVWQRNSDPVTCQLQAGFTFTSNNLSTWYSPNSLFTPSGIDHPANPTGIIVVAEAEAPFRPLSQLSTAIFGSETFYYHGSVF